MTKRSTLAWLWTALILSLCWLPRAWMPVREEGIYQPPIVPVDKFVHFTLFGVFGFLWAWAVPKRGYARLGIVLLAGLALAAVSEAGQELSYIGRDANIEDAVADVLGLISGLAAFAVVERAFKTPSAGTP